MNKRRSSTDFPSVEGCVAWVDSGAATTGQNSMSGEGCLFGPPPFLAWLPDETLFSLISRHHKTWGHSVARRTSELLFLHAHGGTHHDLPSFLAEFERRTGGVHGSAETLARERTLLKYYAAFMPEREVQDAVACMKGHSVAHLKLRLGILTSRFRAHHPLKACDECMTEDAATTGWAYWHLEHQYPGVWICPSHGRLLRESIFKSSGVERFQWHLPTPDTLASWPEATQSTLSGANSHLAAFSILIGSFVSRASMKPVDASRLLEVYRAEIDRRSWLTPGGSLCISAIAQSYLEHVLPLRALPELSSLPETIEDSVKQVGRMLRSPRGRTPPSETLPCDQLAIWCS